MIDANAYVGNWPFRQLRYTTPAALLGKMDALGIEQAVVSSLENVFYKDLLAGNRNLHALVKAQRGPLPPRVHHQSDLSRVGRRPGDLRA